MSIEREEKAPELRAQAPTGDANAKIERLFHALKQSIQVA